MDDVSAVSEERDRLRLEEREMLDRLRNARARLTKLRSELQMLRKTRDELNEIVRGLKERRDELRDSAKKTVAHLKVLRKKAGRTFESVQAQHEMAQLEWKMQTSPLEREEEKRLLGKIRTLESKVDSYRRIQDLSKKVNVEREEADELHERIKEVAQASQKRHEEILQIGDRFQALKGEVEEQTEKLFEIRGRLREATHKYFSLISSLREADQIAELEKQRAYQRSLKESARKKLSQRGKLSLHELHALFRDDEAEEEKS